MRWIIRRTLRMILSIYGVTALTFFIIRLMPGDPVSYLIYYYVETLDWSPEMAYLAVQDLMGYNPREHMFKQFLDYMINLHKGDLGKSIIFNKVPVIEIIAARLPWTAFILSISISLSFLIGILVGTLAAYRRGSSLDSFMSFFSTVMRAIPSYIIAFLFMLLLCFRIPIFPYGGAYAPGIKPGFTLAFIFSIFHYAALPILSFVSVNFATWALAMRSSVLDVLGEDYVMFAEARGLHKRRIMLSYVGRNAILPLFTSLAIVMGGMFGGSTFIETVFTYPGIGWLLGLCINARDYTVMQGCFLIMTITTILSNFISDLLYGKLDPRIRLK